jgi:hypothetical protein
MQDVNTAIAAIKNKRSVQFVDWCPTGFKVAKSENCKNCVVTCARNCYESNNNCKKILVLHVSQFLKGKGKRCSCP